MSRCTPALAALATAWVAHAGAQIPPRGPLVLTLAGSTRAVAMGDAAVATGDYAALFHNPALLASARGTGLAVQRFGAAATLVTAASGVPLAPGGLSLGVRLLEYRVPATEPGVGRPAGAARGEQSLLAPGERPAAQLQGAVGFGRAVGTVRLGAAATYVEEHGPNARAGAAAVDAGAAMPLGPGVLGVAVQNVGRALGVGGQRLELPLRTTVGVAVDGAPLGVLDLGVSTALAFESGGEVRGSVGTEVLYTALEGYTVALRAGLRDARYDHGGRLSLGAAFVGDRVAIEYAFRRFTGPGDAHRLGIRWYDR